MVYKGRNLISKATLAKPLTGFGPGITSGITCNGIWTKLEPEVSHALPLSSSSKLSESNVEIPYSSSQTSPKYPN